MDKLKYTEEMLLANLSPDNIDGLLRARAFFEKELGDCEMRNTK